MMRKMLRSFVTVGVVVATLALATSTGSATTKPTAGGLSSFTLQVPPPPGPSGCNSGNYCSYNTGGGSDLCEQMNGTGNLSSACANKNEAGFNNRTTYGVNLYYGFGETGAYWFLAASDYLLYMADNDFNQCPGGGHSCAGWGQAMGDNLASIAFE